MTDYYLEHGSKQASSVSIRARLKLMSRFMDVEAEAGRLIDPFLPEHLDNLFLERFRAWALTDPIVARKKNEEGAWVPGLSRDRQPSTVEESIIQLKAAVNHAYNNRRIRFVPPLKHKSRATVTPIRTHRLSVSNLAEMLDYTMTGGGSYAGHRALLLPLRRYLIGAICTLARPDAILDMSIAIDRAQWMKDDRRFNLNPAGRPQTKKHRPIIPVNDLLHAWLCQTQQWFICKERMSLDADGEVERVEQIGVKTVRSGWDTMRVHLGLPAGWGPKLIRHSMASELRKRRADPWELSGQLGHRMLRTSEIYAIFDPDYLSTVQAAIADVIADLQKLCGSALLPRREGGTCWTATTLVAGCGE